MEFGKKKGLVSIRFSINLFSCVKVGFAIMNLAWIVYINVKGLFW